MKKAQLSSLFCITIAAWLTIDHPQSNAATQDHKAGSIFKDCSDCPEMVVIPRGSFDMGSPDNKAGIGNKEGPVHHITFIRAFALSKVKITQRQWKAMMGNNPSNFQSCGENCPVEQVSWVDAGEFIKKLNTKTGKEYRLPSEAEWEYSCRAGEKQEFCGSDQVDKVAWYNKNSGGTTHPSATKQANAWGLYDMPGNAAEWVEDSWHDSYEGAPTDGSAWEGEPAGRVIRGAAWSSGAQFAHPTARGMLYNNMTSISIGFRVAKTLP